MEFVFLWNCVWRWITLNDTEKKSIASQVQASHLGWWAVFVMGGEGWEMNQAKSDGHHHAKRQLTLRRRVPTG